MSGNNLEQVYATNPSTTAAATDLLYLAKAPYDDDDDSGIQYQNLAKQILGTNLLNLNFVSVSGNDSNTGSVNAPFQVISYADGLNTEILYITPGAYTDSAYAVNPISWIGVSSDLVTYTIGSGSGDLTLNNTIWADGDIKLFKGIYVNAGNVNLVATSILPNAAIYFEDYGTKNFTIVKNIGTVNLKNTYSPGIEFQDNTTIIVDGDREVTELFYTADTIASNVTIIINNCPNLTSIGIYNNLAQTLPELTLIVTNCLTLGNGGNIQYDDASNNSVFSIYFDATSYPTFIDQISGPAYVLQLIAGPLPYAPINNAALTGTTTTSFLQASNSIYSATRIVDSDLISPPYTMMGPLLANDLIGGTVLCNPSAPLNPFQMPTFTDMESALAAILGVTTVTINTTVYFNIENIGTASVNPAPNTNFTIVTQNGAPIVLGGTSTAFKAIKTSSSTYSLFGA